MIAVGCYCASPERNQIKLDQKNISQKNVANQKLLTSDSVDIVALVFIYICIGTTVQYRT